MRHTLIVGLLVAVAVAVLAPVGAQQPAPGTYGVYGAGTSSCGMWLEARREPVGFLHLMNTTWVQGFVSGVGSAGRLDLKKTDAAGIQAFTDQYCTAHPADDISAAARALVLELTLKKTP